MFNKILRAIGIYIVGVFALGVIMVIAILLGLDTGATESALGIYGFVHAFVLAVYCIFSLFDKREFK